MQRTLCDLRRINRWFGGVRTTRRLIERIVRQTGRRELTLLEVGAGSGDVPRHAARVLAKEDIRLRFTLLDRSPDHLDGAPQAVAGDALALPFRDSTFDLVSCALFAHHLEPNELLKFASEALRVCRIAVLINDLRRSWGHLALVYAGFPLYRSRFTRHDGPASVRRAYTPHEIAEILNATAAAQIEVHDSYLCRMGIILWRGGRRHA